jgi:uncharacterized protein (TIGR01319 family)
MSATDRYGLFIDFGSTFSKIVCFDLLDERVAARAQGPSTVESDIMVGLHAALEDLKNRLGDDYPAAFAHKLACSSAAGGLKMATIGLVPELTVEAAKRAALGAGAKVIDVYAYRMSRSELRNLEASGPDIVLLSGGTDGGDRETILHNAAVLSKSALNVPIVMAGNKVVADDVYDLLVGCGKECIVTDNVMPEINELRVEPVRAIIREVFIRKIVDAKGLRRAEAFVDGILMPTPTAVLAAARLLSQGTNGEPGLGDLAVVDVGGATTDIHSVCPGGPIEPGVVVKGLPEPVVKRTVEGDLGVRHNAATIVAAIGRESFVRESDWQDPGALQAAVERLHATPGRLATSEMEKQLDIALARCASRLAMERHAGRLRSTYGPEGEILIQYGKDLRNVRYVIGTGGPLVFSDDPGAILGETKYSAKDPFSLRPRNPVYLLDQRYLLYAVGLLGEMEPDRALRIGKKYLSAIDRRNEAHGPEKREVE